VRTVLKEISAITADDDLTLAYSGEFRDTLTDRIIELAETYIESSEPSSRLRKKTSFLVAECFQNVIRHGSKDAELIFDSPRRVESFILRFRGGKCFILSENAVPNENVEQLKALLEEVNSVEREKLRSLYRELLKKAEFSDHGGAGLGLIEMTRRSGNKLKYSFKKLDDRYAVFHFMLVLENKSEEADKDYSAEFDQIERIISNLKQENQFLVYQGEFDPDMVNPVTEMIERNLDAQRRSLAVKVKYYHAAINIMNLISRQEIPSADKKDSIISLGITDTGYTIHSRYTVDNATADRLTELLERVRRDGEREGDDIFDPEKGLEKIRREDELADIFIQLSRISRSWEFDLTEQPDSSSLFSYMVLI